MACQRLQCDLAFAADESGRLTAPGAQALYDAAVAAIAAVRVHSVWLTAAESGVEAQQHLCRHDKGEACAEADVREVGVRPVKKLAAAIVEPK